MAWRIIVSGKVRQEIVQLGRHEAANGRLAAFSTALDYLLQQLGQDPLALGNPHNRLKHLGLTLCHAMRRPLVIHFAVDEKRQWVYVRKLILYP